MVQKEFGDVKICSRFNGLDRRVYERRDNFTTKDALIFKANQNL